MAEHEAITAADVSEVSVPPKSKAPRVDALLAELKAEEAKLELALLPYREFYEQHVNDPRYLEAKTKIKQISNLLLPIKNEIAAIARSKGAKGIVVEPGEYTRK